MALQVAGPDFERVCLKIQCEAFGGIFPRDQYFDAEFWSCGEASDVFFGRSGIREPTDLGGFDPFGSRERAVDDQMTGRGWVGE